MKLKQFAAAVMIMVVTQTMLVGCGGGDGGTIPELPVAKTSKGLWVGRQGTTNTSAIVLANGEAWLVFQESGTTTRFARIQTQTAGSTFRGIGNQYLLQSGNVETASISGTFVDKSNFSGSMTAGGNGSKTDFILAYDGQYDKPASLSDAVGTWSGSFGGGTRTLTVAATTGALTGSSTTGCNYSGELQIRAADPALFDVSFTESCPTANPPTSTFLSGIATVNAAKNALSFAVTTNDKKSGALFVGQK